MLPPGLVPAATPWCLRLGWSRFVVGTHCPASGAPVVLRRRTQFAGSCTASALQPPLCAPL
eukprot:4267351-Lingulodinium_polyedra.AAC.1